MYLIQGQSEGQVEFWYTGMKRVNFESMTISKTAKRTIKIRFCSREKKPLIPSGPDLYPGSCFGKWRAVVC